MTSQNIKTSSRALSCCCGDNASSIFKSVENYQLVKCNSCGVIRLDRVYMNPIDFLADVTKDEGLEYWGYPAFYTKHRPIFDHFFTERYERILDAKKINGPWLDIGSGYGFWQMYLNGKGQENTGIEIEKEAVDYAQKQGVQVCLQSIEKYESDQKFAVITMCDVLEHVEKPQEILQKCHDLLLPEGLLYIQVPNVLGLKYPYGDSLGLPHHLWQFNPGSLQKLLKKQKFKISKYWTGVQGIIRHYESGGPGIFRKFMWGIAGKTKRGNRLQVLVSK